MQADMQGWTSLENKSNQYKVLFVASTSDCLMLDLM